MVKTFPRFVLAFAGLVLAAGALLHASAFNKIESAVGRSDLVAFAGKSLKALWLADSATLLILAALFGLIALRPFVTTRWVVLLLALIPAATAVLIYTFVGSFIGGHTLLLAAILAFIGGMQYPAHNSLA